MAAVDLKGLAATTEDLDRARGIGLQQIVASLPLT